MRTKAHIGRQHHSFKQVIRLWLCKSTLSMFCISHWLWVYAQAIVGEGATESTVCWHNKTLPSPSLSLSLQIIAYYVNKSGNDMCYNCQKHSHNPISLSLTLANLIPSWSEGIQYSNQRNMAHKLYSCKNTHTRIMCTYSVTYSETDLIICNNDDVVAIVFSRHPMSSYQYLYLYSLFIAHLVTLTALPILVFILIFLKKWGWEMVRDELKGFDFSWSLPSVVIAIHIVPLLSFQSSNSFLSSSFLSFCSVKIEISCKLHCRYAVHQMKYSKDQD